MDPGLAFVAPVETSGGSFESEEWFTGRRAGVRRATGGKRQELSSSHRDSLCLQTSVNHTVVSCHLSALVPPRPFFLLLSPDRLFECMLYARNNIVTQLIRCEKMLVYNRDYYESMQR